MIGNTKLVDYGIQNDMSDYRAHVAVIAKKVYVFRTCEGKKAAESGKYQKKGVFTGPIKTAVGYVIPPSGILGIKQIVIPEPWMKKIGFSTSDTTTTKGEKAVKIVKGMLLRGLFPIETASEIIDETDLQIKGVDITVNLEFNIQVKCDFKGGIGLDCTGNLFLQIAECNPWKRT